MKGYIIKSSDNIEENAFHVMPHKKDLHTFIKDLHLHYQPFKTHRWDIAVVCVLRLG